MKSNQLKILALFIVVASISSCNNYSNKNFELFNKYLVYQNHLIKNNHNYILIPSNVCSGCIANAIEIIKTVPNLKSTTLITGNSIIFNDSSLNLEKYYDKNSGLDKLNLNLGNMNIIYINEDKIAYNVEITLNNIDSIPIFLSN